ncbi:cation diffusion facilitator family transporter [Thiomonas sp. FB-Cd]|uniref:cation diffusion facilitator family transporter n=1 Tax=Thiomonas sp. FB-Cd TaxID=1158292 RepID=UPI0004DF2CBE|nr:cation diffusion facilitator family transporter [Thiomonas sp. FB-Cd]
MPQDFGARFALGIVLNLAFVAVEAFYGWRSNFLALLADAGHNLGDVGALGLAWAGLAAGRLHANDRHTYGWQRGSILASVVNSTFLLVLMGALALEALQRFEARAVVSEWSVHAVACVGIMVNGGTAWLFLGKGKSGLNDRSAFAHMAADASVSLGVVISAAAVLATGWTWVDPAVTLLIAGVVLWGTWIVFRQSLHLLFDGVPAGIDLTSARAHLLTIPGIQALHDLHVWALSTSQVSLTAHRTLGRDAPGIDAILEQAKRMLHDSFEIRHVTLQIESEAFAASCELAAVPRAACPGNTTSEGISR